MNSSTPSKVIYPQSRTTSSSFSPNLTPHSQALLYLHYSRCSTQKQPQNPYLSTKFPQYLNGLQQPKILHERYSELNEYFEKLMKEEIYNGDELEQLKKIVFLALGLKIYQSQVEQYQIWDQRAWGNYHYLKISKIIIQQIRDIDKRNQIGELKKQDFRTQFMKEIEGKVYAVVSGEEHPNGIQELLHEEAYCFVAEYMNFGSNQVYLRKKKENAEILHKEKDYFDDDGMKRMKPGSK